MGSLKPRWINLISYGGLITNSACILIYPTALIITASDINDGDKFLNYFSLLDFFIGTIFSGILLAGSIGLLKRKEWGRQICAIGLLIDAAYWLMAIFTQIIYSALNFNDDTFDVFISAPLNIITIVLGVLVARYLRLPKIIEYFQYKPENPY